MDRVDSGAIYFKLDNTTDSKKKLEEFFTQFGFTAKPIKIDSVGFSRQTEFTNEFGFKFTIVWFINLAHVRFGDWDIGHFESSFTLIRGAWTQNVDQATFKFYDGENPTIQFSVPYKNFNK